MNKLNLMAPMGKTGYGVVGFNVLRILKERQWDVYLFPRGGADRQDHNEKQMLQFAAGEAHYFDYDAPCLNIWHQFDLAQRVGKGKYIAWPIFELDTFDARERHHLNYPDELIVCSKWAKQVLLDNDVGADDRIHVVPLGVAVVTFNHKIKVERTNNRTIFLNAGKWEIRKGHDILLEIFQRAFNPEDEVELWLMPFNPFLSDGDRRNWEDMYLHSEFGKAGKIKIWPWCNSQRDVATIMAASDCGIFPSRAEGWNLELLEMLALGKYVVTTGYSAHTEFTGSWNAGIVEIAEKEPAFDGKWFFEQGSWAKIGDDEIDCFANRIRKFHECKVAGEPIVNLAGIDTGQLYTWDYTVDRLTKVLGFPCQMPT